MSNRVDNINNHILNNIIIPLVGNKTTYQNELDKIGKLLLNNKFSGVYASDNIPKLDSNKKYAILNLDKSNEAGSHWVAVAKHNNNLYIYDSFGRPHTKIIPSLSKSGNGKILNTELDKEQEEIETNCGARCLSWLLLFDNWGHKMAQLL